MNEIKLGDKLRKLNYNLRAMNAYEKKTGMLFFEFNQKSSTQLTAFLWAGCLAQEPNLTIEEVELWDLTGIDIATAMNEAVKTPDINSTTEVPLAPSPQK